MLFHPDHAECSFAIDRAFFDLDLVQSFDAKGTKLGNTYFLSVLTCDLVGERHWEDTIPRMSPAYLTKVFVDVVWNVW